MQHTACIALQVIRQRVAGSTRLFPHRVVVDIGGRGFALEGVAFGVVGSVPFVGGVGLKTAVFGRHEKLVGGAARGVVARRTVLVHNKHHGFHAQAGAPLGRVCPGAAANVVGIGPVGRANDLTHIGGHRHAAVRCVGVGNRLDIALAVYIGTAPIGLKGLSDAAPARYVRDVVGAAGIWQAVPVVGVLVAHYHDVAFHTGVVCRAGSAVAVGV